MTLLTTTAEMTASQERRYLARQLYETFETSRAKLAKVLFEEREAHRGNGGRGVTAGFKQWLDDAGIPRSTAYRLVAEHEIAIGVRKEKPVSRETRLPEQDHVAEEFIKQAEQMALLFEQIAGKFTPAQLECVRGVARKLSTACPKEEQAAWKLNPHKTTSWSTFCVEFMALVGKESLHKAYRDAARRFHPDHGGNEETFKELQDFWQVIERKMQ